MMYALDTIDSNNERSPDPHKAAGIEAIYQTRQAFMQQIADFTDPKSSVVTFGFNSLYCFHVDPHHPVLLRDPKVIQPNMIGRFRLRSGSRLPLTCAIDSTRKTSAVDRFQQIIDRLSFECLQSIPRKRRAENDSSFIFLVGDHSRDADSIKIRHCDIKQDEVGSVRRDKRQRFDAAARLADDFHPVQAGAKGAQP